MTTEANMWKVGVASVVLACAGWAQVTQRVSVDSSGAQGNGGSYSASISPDGRYVAFESQDSKLVSGDTNGLDDVFVHDRLTGTTERVSVDSSGVEGNGVSGNASISADGRYVAFNSLASNLVIGDTNGFSDVFVRDRLTGTTERVSVGPGGTEGNNPSGLPWISADGRYVAFESNASNLVSGDTNGFTDIFVRDRIAGTTERVSVNSAGTQTNEPAHNVSISADGRYVAFWSYATNLVPGDTNLFADVFMRDRLTGMTERVSIATNGAQGNLESFISAGSISVDGRYVAFESSAMNLVPGDTNGRWDIFVRDRQTGTTERVSVATSGAQGNGGSYIPSISADGRYVAFNSESSNLVSDDTNVGLDDFVRDRDATGFTSQCNAGINGVILCPCSNSPVGMGRGCDNSDGTGGAELFPSGVAYISMDTLYFTTTGEKPAATSILLQGTALTSTGIIYGQGVRCVRGALKRLFVKTAIGGSIMAPDFSMGDQFLTERSAALGDPIQPGQSRYYFVVYRDPVVLGGCPASSTFNATQTGRVDWSP
jgi:Tol biopolymer transport system component